MREQVNTSTTIKRLQGCKRAVSGTELTPLIIKKFADKIRFYKNEIIRMVYNYNDDYDYGINFENNTIVVITNYRIFEIKNNESWFILRKDIKHIKLITKDVFSRDIIECRTAKDHAPVNFDIYNEDSARVFFNYIKATKFDDLPYQQPVTNILVRSPDLDDLKATYTAISEGYLSLEKHKGFGSDSNVHHSDSKELNEELNKELNNELNDEPLTHEVVIDDNDEDNNEDNDKENGVGNTHV